jgi:hypothetical protein
MQQEDTQPTTAGEGSMLRDRAPERDFFNALYKSVHISEPHPELSSQPDSDRVKA